MGSQQQQIYQESLLTRNLNPIASLWGDISTGPLWYFFMVARFLPLLLIRTLLAVWTLITTIWSTIWGLITNWLYILIIIGIFVALYFIHIYWPEFAHFISRHFIPVIGVIYNDFLVLIWNDIFHPIINILIYVWDAMVQVIGFFIYIALNLIVTVFKLVVQLVGELHLPQLFEQIMEIIIPIIKLAISVLQLLVQVGAKLIQVLIPIVIFMLKIFFQYIKIMAKIYVFLIVTLFKLLAPIIKAAVAVVRFVLRVFHVKANSSAAKVLRSILSVADGDPFRAKADEGLSGASHMHAWNMYAEAMRYYSVKQFDSMFEGFEEIHKGVRGQDVFHSQDGYPTDPGKGIAYERGLYAREDLEIHELPEEKRSVARDAPVPRMPRPQHRRLSQVEEDILDSKRDDFVEALIHLKNYISETLSPPKDDLPDIFVDTAEDMFPGLINESEADFPHTGRAHRSNQTYEQWHASLEGTDEDWKIDHTWNMTDEEIFPRLKGQKVRRARLHTLYREKTREEVHKVRLAATAWKHALEHGVYRVYKRHIATGRMHRAIHGAWKGLSGHDTVESWADATFGSGRYVSVAHFVHSLVPDFTTHPIGKLMIEQGEDKDCQETPPKKCRHWHQWVREEMGHPSGMMPVEWYAMMEAEERFIEEKDYLESGDGTPVEPLENVHNALNKLAMYGGGEYKYTGEDGVRRRLHIANGRVRLLLSLPGGRELLVFDLPLEFLYERDCFHDPKNILCIPQLPDGWKLPRWNVSAFFLTDNLDHNPSCEPTWRSTSCIICWDGFVNAIREIQFSIYWLDLLSIILIFGIFVPRPSELLGFLGKLFPPLNPLISWFLLYPVGQFPPGSAFACWFINLFYLFELIIALLIAYYIINPFLQWGLAVFNSFYQLYQAWYAGWLAHRQDMEIANEQRLAVIEKDIRMTYLRNMRSAKNGAKPIGAQMMGGGPDVEQGFRDPPPFNARNAQGVDRNALAELMRLRREIRERSENIRSNIDQLSGRLGVRVGRDVTEPADDSPQLHMPRSWLRVMSAMIVPPELTPAYDSAVLQQRERERQTLLPGLANLGALPRGQSRQQ